MATTLSVKELIEKLQSFDPELPVLLEYDGSFQTIDDITLVTDKGEDLGFSDYFLGGKIPDQLILIQ
jgi:hypothetical protein